MRGCWRASRVPGFLLALAGMVLLTACAARPGAATPFASDSAPSTPAPDSAVVALSDEATFESLKAQGRPTVLLVLDPTYP